MEGLSKEHNQCRKVTYIHIKLNFFWKRNSWSCCFLRQGCVLLERQIQNRPLCQKKKSHECFFTVTASAVLCFLDHTLYDLGSHSIPNCKLSLGPVTFFIQFPILPLLSPAIQNYMWVLRKTIWVSHLFHSYYCSCLLLFHVYPHVQFFLGLCSQGWPASP